MVNLNFSIVRLQCVQMQTLDFQSKRLLKEAPIRSEHCGPVWGSDSIAFKGEGCALSPILRIGKEKFSQKKKYCCFIRKF